MGSVLGAIPVAATVANPIIQHYETTRQMKFQEEQNSINRDWQTVEAEKARQFSAEQQQKAMDYNSPVYQANELTKAGINPVLAMQGGHGIASISGGSAAPMASPVGGVSPVQSQPIDLQIPQLMNGLGSMFKNLAEAKQLGINTDILTRSAEYLIKNNMLTAQQKEIGNSLLAIDKYIAEKVKDAKVTRIWDESKKALFDAVISSNEADRGNLISRVLESQERFNNALSKYHGSNTDLINLEVANFDKKLRAYINLSNAQAKQALSTADVNKEKTRFDKFTNDMRDNFKINEYDSYIKELNAKGILSDADSYEAMRKISLLSNLRGNEFIKRLDESLEWIKGKISIFGK